MKAVAALIFIVFVVVIILAVIWAIQRFQNGPREWKVKRVEDPHANCTEFWLVKPPESAEFVGRASRSRDDYSDMLLELQSRAEDKMYDWNSANKALKAKGS